MALIDQMLNTVPLPAEPAGEEPGSAAQEDLLRADAAMEQMSSDLLAYSSDLQAVLSKLHALAQ